MKWPVRKSCRALKVSLFLIFVVAVFSLVQQWRDVNDSSRSQSLEEQEYEKQILEDEARIVPGLGEGGAAVSLHGEDKRLGEESEKNLAVNVYISDRIAYNRSLDDRRHPACAAAAYDAQLPSASVVLVFHNEPYSLVVRTVWSVVEDARRDRPWFRRANFSARDGRVTALGSPGQDPESPFVYLKEVVLVDDGSTLPELRGKLGRYVRTRLPPGLVRVVRLPDCVGLMRARQEGARRAAGDVLVFLDAHCEAQRDWLRPLLQRVKDAPHAVVVPIIDTIDAATFHYHANDPNLFKVGGFTFSGDFRWIVVPQREKERRGSDIAPTWSPTMAGGLLALDREYYWRLGAYDEQMAGWGGENLEMSFRVWQCGGTLETIPCSRVGHVFRAFHPYRLPASIDTNGINTARMAEVWMDDYAELFYLHRRDLRKSPMIGDVSERRALRHRLRCKSFQWFLETVCPEKLELICGVRGYGRFSNPPTGLCLDTIQRSDDAAPLGLYSCHERLETSQWLVLTRAGELRDEERCAALQDTRQPPEEEATDSQATRRVHMTICHGGRGQKWRYLPSTQLQHEESGLCMTTGARAGDYAEVGPCRAGPGQLWKIDYSERNDFYRSDVTIPSDQAQRLERLRRQCDKLSELANPNGTTRGPTVARANELSSVKAASQGLLRL